MTISFGFNTLRSIIIDGKDSVVIFIISDRTTPSNDPFASRASAIGIVLKMSVYIGIPAMVARIIPDGFLCPRIFTVKFLGMQL